MTLLTPNPYSVQPGQCPVHEVERPKCAVRGLVAPGGMCGKVIVGATYCGHSGECVHKVMPTIVQQALSGKPAQEE